VGDFHGVIRAIAVGVCDAWVGSCLRQQSVREAGDWDWLGVFTADEIELVVFDPPESTLMEGAGDFQSGLERGLECPAGFGVGTVRALAYREKGGEPFGEEAGFQLAVGDGVGFEGKHFVHRIECCDDGESRGKRQGGSIEDEDGLEIGFGYRRAHRTGMVSKIII